MDLPDSPPLFVVSCPACGGWSCATAVMADQAACCPQCAATFIVPRPRAAAPAAVQLSPPAAGTGQSPAAAVALPPAITGRSPAPSPHAAASGAAADRPFEPASPMAEPHHPFRQVPPDEQAPSSAGPAEPLPTFDIPDHVLAHADPVVELQFRDAVKTVGRGPNVIELRRLTPEERESRRRWRNTLMLLTGAAILIAIVLLFGTGRHR